MKLRQWHTRRRGGEEGIHEPNMTPLIDVSLVLVVILMVATPLAFQSSIALRTAAASGRDARDRSRAARTELVVQSDGRVRVNREVVERARLGTTLGVVLEGAGSRMIVIRCEPGVTHGAFVGVLDAAKAAGASPIAVQAGVPS